MAATTAISKHHQSAGARFTVLLLGLLFAGPALAHDPGLSVVDLRFKDDQLLAHLTFARPDIGPLLPRSDFLEVKVDGSSAVARQISTQFNSSTALEVWMRFALQSGRCVAIRSPVLGDLALGHRQYLAVRDTNGGLFTQQMLSASNDRIELSLSAVHPASPPFSMFLVHGVEQIFTGYYHLALLFILLLVGGMLRSAQLLSAAIGWWNGHCCIGPKHRFQTTAKKNGASEGI